MITFEQAVNSEKYIVECALQVGGSEAVADCEAIPGTVYHEDKLVAISTKSSVLGREAPAVGASTSGQISATILRPDKFPPSARLVPFVRAKTADGYTPWTPRGVFFVDSRSKRRINVADATMDVVGFDGLMLCDGDYVPQTTLPATDLEVLSDICAQTGLQLSPGTEAMVSQGFSIGPDAVDYSMREILGIISGMYGGSVICNRYGLLEFVPLSAPDESADLTPERLYLSDTLQPFSKVSTYDASGNAVEAGDGTGRTLHFECPWATQEVVEHVLSVVAGYAYTPYQAKRCIIPPDMDFGSGASVMDVRDRAYTVNVTFGRKLVADVQSPDEKELNHGQPFVSSATRGAGRGAAAAAKREQAIAFNQLVAALNGLDGAPPELMAGLQNYVTYDLDNNEAYANSALFAQIDKNLYAGLNLKADKTVVETLDGKVTTLSEASADLTARVGDAEASLKLTAQEVNGISGSVATLQADVVNLQGRVDLTGSLSVSGGTVRASGDIEALTGTVVANTIAAGSEFLIGGQAYTPESITSTSGAVFALGIA